MSAPPGAAWSERIDASPTHQICGLPARCGRPLPFGATLVPGGINFSVYSNHATGMTLVLYRRGEPGPLAELPFPPSFRMGGVYAMTVFGLDIEEIEYGFRADGPCQPGQGHRFAPGVVLSDPYARQIAGREQWGDESSPYAGRARLAYDDFDWEDDHPLRLPSQDLVIYELHVRGFTRHRSSGVSAPGTFAGLTEKIPYLRELGVNCVELMPVCEFDELDNPRTDPATGRRLYNYWGYNPVSFFALKSSYAATSRFGTHLDEFKNLVKQLHRAGIEVILDVVFNHSGEGNELGRTFSFRGLDNATYYMLTPDGWYYNFSGTGNTLNCNHAVVRAFLIDCLRYWASEFHVDGFRFDLASVLGRAPDGSVLANPPLLESLAHDPVLRDCKLIAEAWDAAGLYQVGSFPAYCRWSEWNGRYRDTIRRFIKGDPGMAGDMATRLAGSADLYLTRGSSASVNFITAHDGFTLRDLVSYTGKHNESNGEDNRDGDNGNHSWNCGHEGPTENPDVLALRDRQVGNAFLLLLASRGIPMLLAGDELGRTQHGNNNAYCHDEESWLDWNLVRENAGLLRFVRRAIAFRHAHPVLRGQRPPGAAGTAPPFPEVSWHGVRAWDPDWSADARLVAAMFCAAGPDALDCVFIAANARWESIRLELPELPPGLAWHLFADTGAGPAGSHEPGREPVLACQSHVTAGPRSVLALTARAPAPGDAGPIPAER
jgi:isoamylase